MKRRTLQATAIIALSGLLTACALGGGAGTNGTADSAGPVEITFQSLDYQDSTVAAVKDVVARWNAENPDIQVKLTQGSWDSVQDQLVTQFQGGTAPDVIHNEAANILGFANQGYLADIGPYLSDGIKQTISDDVWETVTTSDGEVIAAPTLLQTYVVFANIDAFEAAGVEVPAGNEVSWDDLRDIASELTSNGQYGIGWGLRQPTAAMMNTALGYGGTFFDVAADGSATIEVGANELAVPETINAMTFHDKSMDPVTLTQSGSDVLLGFLGGKYAMYVGASFLAQQITEAAPEGFNWTVLPPLAGDEGTVQAANPKTMSVAAESDHVEESVEFINYFMSASNQAQMAEGEWQIPSPAEARTELTNLTVDQTGWKELIATGENLKGAPFLKTALYPQWKEQIATPLLQQYFADAITLEELQAQLTEGFESLTG